jgi:hypothetical protein
MTRDEILNMKAGTKINQLVWWKVFDMEPMPPNNNMLLLPDYSIDISAAWDVVDKILKTFPADDIELRTTIRGWICIIGSIGVDYKSNAETAPLAICRAALIAVMEEK